MMRKAGPFATLPLRRVAQRSVGSNMNKHPGKELLSEIVNRVTAAAGARRVFLFGSAAQGKMNRDSDFDLLVLQAARNNVRAESVRLRESRNGSSSTETDVARTHRAASRWILRWMRTHRVVRFSRVSRGI
jgi:predicted nucleotidyltransferase